MDEIAFRHWLGQAGSLTPAQRRRARAALAPPAAAPRGGPLRVLYVCHSFPPFEMTGSPLLAEQIARNAVKNGVTVAVAFALPPGTTGTVPPHRDGITLIPIPAVPGHRLQWSLAESAKPFDTLTTLPEVAAFRPDIIHIIGWVSLPATLLATARALGVPVVRHVCNFEDVCALVEPTHRNPDQTVCQPPIAAQDCAACLHRRGVSVMSPGSPTAPVTPEAALAEQVARKWRMLARQHGTLYDHLVFISASSRDYYARVVDIASIPNSVIEHAVVADDAPDNRTAPALRRPDDGPLRLVFLGPCTPQKGWDSLSEAVARLLDSRPGCLRLTVYGAPPDGAGGPLAGRAEVAWNGRYARADLPGILAAADVGVLPSRFETYSRVAREMLQAGLPVIGSRAFGIPDAIADGGNGLLLPEVSADALHAAIARLLDDRALVERLRHGAQATRLRTQGEEYAEIAALYERLLTT
mgnify:CR=1 FL=1